MNDMIDDLQKLQSESRLLNDGRFDRLVTTAELVETTFLNLGPQAIVEIFESTNLVSTDNVEGLMKDCAETVRLHDSIDDDDEYQNNKIVMRSRVMLMNISIHLTGTNPTDSNVGVMH